MKVSDFKSSFQIAAEKMNEGIRDTRDILISYIKWLQSNLDMDYIVFDAGSYFPYATNVITDSEEKIVGVKVSKTGDLMLISDNDFIWAIADVSYDFEPEEIFHAVQSWAEPRTDYINSKAESKSNSETQTPPTEVEENEPETLKQTYRIRYAMEIFVDANSPEDAEQAFEYADIKEGDFVEVEDISEQD